LVIKTLIFVSITLLTWQVESRCSLHWKGFAWIFLSSPFLFSCN